MFVRDCVDRIDRDLGRADWWKVTIVPDRACFTCHVIVQCEGVVQHATGNGFDAAVAAWDAFHLIRKHRIANDGEVAHE